MPNRDKFASVQFVPEQFEHIAPRGRNFISLAIAILLRGHGSDIPFRRVPLLSLASHGPIIEEESEQQLIAKTELGIPFAIRKILRPTEYLFVKMYKRRR